MHRSSYVVVTRLFRRQHHVLVFACTSSILLGLTSHISAALVAITSPATSSTASAGDFTLGYRFTVGSQSLSVTSLGIWDNNGDGLETGGTGARQMAIWDAGGTLVPGTSVTVPTNGTLDNQFRYQALTSPVTLLANTDYVIGFDSNGLTIHNSSFTTSESPTFNTTYLTLYDVPGGGIPTGQRARRINGGGFSFPNSVAGGGTPWEANFMFSVVPEPSSFSAMMSGLVTMMMMRAKRRNAKAIEYKSNQFV